MALWQRVSTAEMRPFIRRFFGCVAITGVEGLTDPWLTTADIATDAIGEDYDPDQICLGAAVTRGLLIDVLATGTAADATRSVELFIEMWRATGAQPTRA